MEFITDVENQFKKAGWFEGRSVKSKFDKISKIDQYPQFLKDFLYEYGDLIVPTSAKHAKGTLKLNSITSGFFNENSLINIQYYGNIKTYAIGYYDLDNTTLECDETGKVYMSGDFPCLISDDFKKGIEKVIMEDYSNTLQWDDEMEQWIEIEY